MYQKPSLRRRRETVVILTLAVLFSTGIFLFLLLISGGVFLSMLVASAVLVIISCLHYLIWGHRLDRTVSGQATLEDGWTRSPEVAGFFPDHERAEHAPPSPSSNGSDGRAQKPQV